MHDVPADAVAALFAPERPGPIVHAHVAATGVGRARRPASGAAADLERRRLPGRAHPVDRWISATWGGHAGLAASGVAWGAFADGRLVSVAASFFVGAAHEDIAVVTELGHRGRGLSTACCTALIADIRARGHRPTWTTSPDNAGSRAVADGLGFVHERDDVLYAVGVPIPVD